MMKTKFALLATATLFLAACNTLSGTRSYAPNPASHLQFAGTDKDVRTVVVGSVNGIDNSAVAQQFADHLTSSYSHFRARFTPNPSGSAVDPYKVVLALDPPFSQLSHEICANPSAVKAEPKGNQLRIRAIFCETRALSEVTATMDRPADINNPRFQELLRILAGQAISEKDATTERNG